MQIIDNNGTGTNGITPHIGENGNWFIGTTDTGIDAEGTNGITPHIGENGNWFIGTTDTGIEAEGTNGITPHIGENGNWFIGTTDTGVSATGTGGGGSSLGWFSIIDYGASTAATAVANTTAINAAMTAALAVNGTVYIPYGTYFVNTILYNPSVSIIGDGKGSILKSASAVPLLSYTGNLAVNSYGSVENLVLDGNSIGTIGLEYYDAVDFRFTTVLFIGFTQYCVYLKGSLIGSLNGCIFSGVNGLKAESNPLSSVGLLHSNLVTFNSCIWNTITGIGLDWFDGAGVYINSGNFEVCGTRGNAETGPIRVSGMSPYTEGIAMVLDKCWFEANEGTMVNIKESANISNYVIQNSIIQFSNNALYGIYLNGATHNATLSIMNSVITGHPVDLVVNGSKAIIKYFNTTFGTSSQLNSGGLFSTSDIVSSASNGYGTAVAKFQAAFPYPSYPQGQFLVGSGIGDTNITLLIASLFSSNSNKVPVNFSLSTNKDVTDNSSDQFYTSLTNALCNIMTLKGANLNTNAVPIALSPGGYESIRFLVNGRILAGTTIDNGIDKMQINGTINSTQYKLSALNIPPISATDTGVLGEIRYDANYIYFCFATNQWKRSPLTTW